MPANAKPLFRPVAIRPRQRTFSLSSQAQAARPKLAHWANLLGSPQAATLKETELLGDFIRDVFGDLLGCWVLDALFGKT